MAEAVRLVVWDLDETFWKGTVTEGGITEYVQAHHDIVVELARRGIMSSICSKNDSATILPILEEKGIAEYFIFPSIDWEPKGMRLARLVETVQLRAPTIMFIDDNPGNRAEAAAVVPGLQVEDEGFIPRLLADPRFTGKDDSGLSRLKQYRLLEARKRDEAAATATGSGNEAFLRRCNIRICLEYDIERHIDRAVELVNRTNQLNFTRHRLSEDPAEAAAALLKQARTFPFESALVRVVDDYGDYGFIGFFMVATTGRPVAADTVNIHNPGAWLAHFCFSCRTLGMYVEQWVYEYLGRPFLPKRTDVLTDLSVAREIDWITLVPEIDVTVSRFVEAAGRIVICGGCEAQSIGFYLQGHTPQLTVHGNYSASGLFVNANGSRFLLKDRMSPLFTAEVARIGLPAELELHDEFSADQPPCLFVFNLDWDIGYRTNQIRHRQHGWEFAFGVVGVDGSNALTVTDAELEEAFAARPMDYPPEAQQRLHATIRHLRANYEPMAPLDDAGKVASLRALMARLPIGAKCIFIGPSERIRWPTATSPLAPWPDTTSLLGLLRDAIGDAPWAGLVLVDDAIQEDADILVAAHYTRRVYQGIAQRIVTLAGLLAAKAAAPVPERLPAPMPA